MDELESAEDSGRAEWSSRSVQLADLHAGDLGIHDPSQRLTVHTRGTVASARHAIVMPIHNQAANIHTVLSDLSASVSLAHELCLIVDDCSDDSLGEVHRWIAGADDRSIERVTIAVSEHALFETLCDVIGFALTSAPFVIEVQADMFVHDPGFDERLLDWFSMDSRLLAVSGRGGHDLARRSLPTRAAKRLVRLVRDQVPGSYTPLMFEYLFSDEIGRTGPRISRPSSLRRADRLFLHETVLRGPLVMSRALYDRVGGLDPSRFFLGDDDHDLCARARRQGLIVGYTPVRFDSPLEEGSTRAERTAEQKATYARFVSFYRHRGSSASTDPSRVPRVLRRVLRSTSTPPAR